MGYRRSGGIAANRRILSRVLMVLGALALGLAVVFALLPASPPACGSLLAPMFPPGIGTPCAAAQAGYIPAAAASAVLGLVAAIAGVLLVPNRGGGRRS